MDFSLFNHFDLIVQVVDSDLKVVYLNQAAAELLSESKDEWIGKSILELPLPDQPQLSYQVELFTFNGHVLLLYREGNYTQKKQRILDQILQEKRRLQNSYEKALDQHSIVARTDLKGKIIYVNEKFCDISGYSREELIGQDHRIVNSKTHPKEFFQNMWETIQSGKTWYGEVCNKSKSGNIYWVDTTITPVRDATGQIFEYIAVRTEITKQNELLQLLDDVQKMGKIGGWELDVESGATKWTDETYRIHELPIGVHTAKEDGISFYAPHERERITRLVSECITEQKAFDEEFELITAKKNFKWVRSMGKPVLNREGEVIKLIGTFQDVTVKKQQELSLNEIKDKTKVLNDILRIDRNTKRDLKEILTEGLTYVLNIPWLNILEKGGIFLVKDEQLELVSSIDLGPKIENLCAKVDKGKCLCGRAFEQKKTIHASCVDHEHEITFEGISAHGHYNVPLKYEGEFIGVMVLYLEHGHQRNQEEVDFLESCTEVLSQIVVAYRAEEALVVSRNEALKAEKAKSEFLANMSHEIRTPLNGLLGMVQLLQLDQLTPDQKEMVNTIEKSGESLLVILNDILDISKFESGKLVLEHENFDLKKSISDILDLFEVNAFKKGIKLKFEYNLEQDHFIGDLVRVKQIVSNLVSNAIKFTDKGSVSITVDSSLNGGKKGISLIVRDTGVGIAKEAQNKMFAAFTQADSSITRKYGGTGLGLRIAKQLIELMQGKIELESELGVGTAFKLFIPLQQAKQDKISTSEFNFDMEETAARIPHKILLVEDNIVNQKTASMLFAKMGYEIDIANDGEQAIEKVAINEYSVIFMDLQMPKMDGISATQVIREQFNHFNPAIIALTANAFAEDKQRCLQAGMDAFLSKPLKLKELRSYLLKFYQEPSKNQA